MKNYLYSVIGRGLDLKTIHNSYGVVYASSKEEAVGLGIEKFKKNNPNTFILMHDVSELTIENK